MLIRSDDAADKIRSHEPRDDDLLDTPHSPIHASLWVLCLNTGQITQITQKHVVHLWRCARTRHVMTADRKQCTNLVTQTESA